ncbi:MAG: hypothetical protein V9H69_04965 [Anaerolineae bacterium]
MTQPKTLARQDVASPGPWLHIARLGVLVFTTFCIAIFLWGLLLIPQYGLLPVGRVGSSSTIPDQTPW